MFLIFSTPYRFLHVGLIKLKGAKMPGDHLERIASALEEMA